MRGAISALGFAYVVLSGWNAAAAGAERGQYRAITIPAGTPLNLSLASSISSKTSSVEDPVMARLRRALVVKGVTVVPAGATVIGHVVEATRSGRVKRRARVGIRFTALRASDGRHTIRTSEIARQAPSTKKRDAQTIGIGAAAAAVVGAVTGGSRGGAVGSAVGAAGGTGVALITRGDEVALAPGTIVTTRLTAPVTVRLRIP